MSELPGQASAEQGAKTAEQEYQSRASFQEGMAPLEVLRLSTRPEQIHDAARSLMASFEDMSLHRDGTFTGWRLDDAIMQVAERSKALSYDRGHLADMGYVDLESLDPETGSANFAFPGYCLTTRIEIRPRVVGETFAPDGKTVISMNVQNEPSQLFILGTDQEREYLSNVLRWTQAEMKAREDLVNMLRWVWNQTENLDDLVKFYYMGSLTNEAMTTLCNAEGRKKVLRGNIESTEKPDKGGLFMTDGGVEYREGHEFGDAMGVALQCFEIAAASESPRELERLLKTPGAKLLFNVSDQEIDDIFLPPDQRVGRRLNAKLVAWIGEPWRWSNAISGPKENVRNEERSRGLLTKKGNILVESSWADAEWVFGQVERFIGGGPDSKAIARLDARDARFIAWGLLRTTGMASELGKQLYKQECVDGVTREVESHDLGGMTSCDRVKVYLINVFRRVYRNLKPEVRNYGPDGSLDQYPDRLTVAYFKQWTGSNEHGAKRTYQEMRWGYRAGMGVDLLTGRSVAMPEEKAYRLGELPWGKLTPKAFNNAALGPYIAGREGVGLFVYVKRTDWKVEELMDESFAKSLANWLGIAINEQTVFDGRFRGVYNGNQDHDVQVKKEKVKPQIREYKKQFIRSWWDGLRSLPQWRLWKAMDPIRMDSHSNPSLTNAIERVKYRLGRVEILTPKEAADLPTDFFYPLSDRDKAGYKGY